MLPPCVGRDAALTQVRERLEVTRWLTLVGAPGCGKSLLARWAVADRDHVVWVPIGHLADTAAVLAACLRAVDVSAEPGEEDHGALVRALDGTDTLLVLDGAVHEHDGLGAAVESLLESTTDVMVLATALTMAGRPSEHVVRVDPLPVPAPGEPLRGPAVDLLCQCVEKSGGRPLDLDAAEGEVREILAASAGLPLVIEQTGSQIALVGAPNVTPSATPSEAVETSYSMLHDDHRRAFRRLALLEAPASLDVVADILETTKEPAGDVMGLLVRRSLVETHPDGRFGMLAPIRRHGATLASVADRWDVDEALRRWADRVLPTDVDSGAADAPWLVDRELMRGAIARACSSPATRDDAYRLANRAYGSLYTAMHARDALEILEATLASGDGPADVGAQLARRAGVAASEVRGTYAGMPFLDRAEQHADRSEDPDLERARTASIRAEMHLDAGELDAAVAEAEKVIELDADPYAGRQARRTLMDVKVARGDFAGAEALVPDIIDGAPDDERWIGLAARVLLAEIAHEQGRYREAAATARWVRSTCLAIGEERIALLADTVVRGVTGEPSEMSAERDQLPWAVRILVLVQDVREMLQETLGRDRQGVERVVGRAADVVVLADDSRLDRGGVLARLVLGDALMVAGDRAEASATYLGALRRSARVGLPLRSADALDGAALVLAEEGNHAHRLLAATAHALRTPSGAVRRPRAGLAFPSAASAVAPEGWVVDGRLTPDALEGVAALFAADTNGSAAPSPIDQLTRAQRAVAELVAEGLTSREIAQTLFVSPRTVDTHLAHIYRKVGISSRARLAAMMTGRA